MNFNMKLISMLAILNFEFASEKNYYYLLIKTLLK